jgi:hypothetical protein
LVAAAAPWGVGEEKKSRPLYVHAELYTEYLLFCTALYSVLLCTTRADELVVWIVRKCKDRFIMAKMRVSLTSHTHCHGASFFASWSRPKLPDWPHAVCQSHLV